MRSIIIKPKGANYLLTLLADGHTRQYTYSTFAGAYKRAQRLCEFLDMPETAIRQQNTQKKTKGVIL